MSRRAPRMPRTAPFLRGTPRSDRICPAIAPSGTRLQRPRTSQTSFLDAPDPTTAAPHALSIRKPHRGHLPLLNETDMQEGHGAGLQDLVRLKMSGGRETMLPEDHGAGLQDLVRRHLPLLNETDMQVCAQLGCQTPTAASALSSLATTPRSIDLPGRSRHLAIPRLASSGTTRQSWHSVDAGTKKRASTGSLLEHPLWPCNPPRFLLGLLPYLYARPNMARTSGALHWRSPGGRTACPGRPIRHSHSSGGCARTACPGRPEMPPHLRCRLDPPGRSWGLAACRAAQGPF